MSRLSHAGQPLRVNYTTSLDDGLRVIGPVQHGEILIRLSPHMYKWSWKTNEYELDKSNSKYYLVLSTCGTGYVFANSVSEL